MKTELSKSINPLDQGRISEDEMTPKLSLSDISDKAAEYAMATGYMDALMRVTQLPSIQNKLTIDERLEILNLYKK